MLLEQSQANDQGVELGWHGRLASAARRRARRAWRTMAVAGACPRPIEAALDWLLSQATSQGMPRVPGGPADFRLTRLCLATVSVLGQHQLARDWQARLSDWPAQEGEELDRADHERASPLVEFARQTAHDYLRGDRAEAETAWARLVRMQKPSGAIPCGWHGAAWRSESVLATKYFLDASVLQARLAFDADASAGLPDEIAPEDGRLQAVVSGLFPLADRASRVVDVGCGSGRFLKRLAARFPELAWTGVDPCPSLLDALPAGIARRSGGLPSIPADDGEFDGAVAVESLEHALTPAAAVAELCRVVRPGGRVLIVDKHLAWQPLSEHERWERWFQPHEVLEWLGRHCDRVAAWPVAHGEHSTPSGLFWCWSGRRA